MALRHKQIVDGETIIWEMLPAEEVRYREEWVIRAATGQTHGAYLFEPVMLNGSPFLRQGPAIEFEIPFGYTADEPFNTTG